MARGRKMQQAANEKTHFEEYTPKSKLRMSFKPDEGSLVEVASDEEGFKGVWYIATVLGMESLHRAYVEYCSLVSDEDSSEPLREYVDVDFIRPLPPREKTAESFEVGHLVDGYYQDGWWTGVITGVIFGGVSFVVTFQNPPDQHVFGCAKLRFHRRWVNGKWEKPGKRDTQSLVFGTGKNVEVCRGNHFIPATIMEERGKGYYDISYDKKREIMDSKVIRPSPPTLKDHVFLLGDTVDAALGSGWWCGSITKLLPDSSFNVLIESGNRQKRFSHVELRLHLEWNQGNWDVSKVLPLGLNQVQNKTLLSNESLSGDDATSSSSLPQTYQRKRKEVHEEDVPISISKKVAVETSSNAVVRGSQGNDDGVQLVRIVTLQKSAAGEVEGDTEPHQENIKRRRGRPRKISGIPASGVSAEEAIVDRVMTVDNDFVKDLEFPTQEAAEFPTQVAVEIPTQEAVEIPTQEAVEIPTQEAVINAEQSDVVSNQIMEEGTKIENVPFVKKNTILWSTIESMEPFQKWPQKPHFRPLEQYDVSCHEGKALGLMISFNDIVERSLKPEFLYEAKSSSNELLGFLLELEDNGFDVRVVRDRMAIRENREKLQAEYEEINGEIAKQNMEMVELDKKVEELKMQMKKVQEEMSEAMSKKEAKSREVASLQLKLEELNLGMVLPGDSLLAD